MDRDIRNQLEKPEQREHKGEEGSNPGNKNYLGTRPRLIDMTAH